MLRTLVVKYRTHMDMELQQRAVEYTQFWTLSREQRLALLERIPVLESAEREESTKGLGSGKTENYVKMGLLIYISFYFRCRTTWVCVG